jgi:hypothetical protein
MKQYSFLTVGLLVAFAYGHSTDADAAKRKKYNRNLKFSQCPWKGSATIEDMRGGTIIIANTKFKLKKPRHLFAFQSLLNLCNAESVIPLLSDWRQAQSLVTAKAAAGSAYAVSAGLRAALTDSDAERRAIAREAAEQAALFATEIIPLTADAKAKKQMFLAELMASSAP